MPKTRFGKGSGRLAKKRTIPRRLTRSFLNKLVQNKKKADKKKVDTINWVPRTVEMASACKPGDESTKLLFMMALDLMPNYKREVAPGLTVKLDRLQPEVEAKAKTVTEKRIADLVQNREAPAKCQQRQGLHVPADPMLVNLELKPLYPLPKWEKPCLSPENCEAIDPVYVNDKSVVEFKASTPNPEVITVYDDEQDVPENIGSSFPDLDWLEYESFIDTTEYPDNWFYSREEVEQMKVSIPDNAASGAASTSSSTILLTPPCSKVDFKTGNSKDKIDLCAMDDETLERLIDASENPENWLVSQEEPNDSNFGFPPTPFATPSVSALEIENRGTVSNSTVTPVTTQTQGKRGRVPKRKL